MAKRDYYEVLGVPRDADAATMKRAYRRLAMQFHRTDPNDPKRGGQSSREATEAYTVLSDERKRKRSTTAWAWRGSRGQGAGGFDPADFGSVGDLLEGLFGDVFGGRGKRRTGGRDLTYDLSIEFVEAALGTEKTIQVERPGPCTACEGVGAEPGTKVDVCETCTGRGQVRQQRGFFAVSRPCAACRGTGKRIQSPCRTCSGSGTQVRKEDMVVRIPAGVQDGAVAHAASSVG
ncbi:MAG: DnaJ domain-containing protein [Sandaracinaceae bacterium]|nr:DnaJ domain-containing protein [Sandaracinaceae bacterium]